MFDGSSVIARWNQSQTLAKSLGDMFQVTPYEFNMRVFLNKLKRREPFVHVYEQ